MLSAERTAEETTWSLGRYATGAEIWTAFKLPGDPPPAVGVYANQPSPYAGTRGALLGHLRRSRDSAPARGRRPDGQRRATAGLQRDVHATSRRAAESSFVTPIFEIGPRPSNVEVSITTNARNNWIYFDLALINADTGDAYDFGREVSYYSGTDSDGNWTEGSDRDDAVLPTTAPGRYYLRVEPETEKTSPRGGLHDHRAPRRAVAALLSDRPGRAPGSADLRVDAGRRASSDSAGTSPTGSDSATRGLTRNAMRGLGYLIFGLLTLGSAGFADYRGWSLVRPAELHNLPDRFATTPGRTARSTAARPITSEASNVP